MKNKHYTEQEILKISKLLSEGKTYGEIAIILDRDYTRLTRKINELELYRYKRFTRYSIKTTTAKRSQIEKTIADIKREKLEHYNNQVKLYFKGNK